MKVIGRLVFLFALFVVSASAGLYAQGPNPNQPFIQSLTYGGSGCPQGSVGQSFSNDRMSSILIFDNFVASSGPGVPITENRKNCGLNVNVHVPNGSGQFCALVTYRGYVQLPAGTGAEAAATYSVSAPYELPDGQVITIGNEGQYSQSFTGPISKDHIRRDSVELSWNGAEPAVTPLGINAEAVLIDAGASPAQITNDSIDLKLVPGPCVGEDTTPPTIAISNPVLNGLYGLGATVTPAFTCADEGGSGVASCTAAPVIDTTSIGPKTFVVTAVDAAGNTSTASVSYAVGGKNECKGGGHSRFLAPTFKNQGQCISLFVK